MKKFQRDDVEVDDCTAAGASDALVLSAEGGAWVKAWLWVTNEEAEREAPSQPEAG